MPVPLSSVAVLQSFVETATGPLALVVVFGYSFLVAFALPLPGEVVLAAPLDLGTGAEVELSAIVLASSFGKALGSLAALRVGQQARAAGRVGRLLGGLPLPALNVQGRLVAVARTYGHLGLAGALSVPFAPDTAVIYAFSVVGTDRLRFAAAAFVGTVVRLLVVAGVAGALLAVGRTFF